MIASRYDWGQDPGASISGTGWATSINVLNRLPQYTTVASVGGTTTTLNLHLGAPQTIGLIHLQNLITDPGGTIEVVAGSYDSGLVSSWASDANGTYDQHEYKALGRPRFFVPPVPVVADSVQVTINDANGNVTQVGYLGACEIWQAPINMSYDWSITVIDLGDVQRTPFGSTFTVDRGKIRRFQFGVDFLLQPGIYGEGVTDQVFSTTLANALIAGQTFPLAACMFPDDTANLERTSVWGLSSNQQPFSNPFFATWNTSFQIDQRI